MKFSISAFKSRHEAVYQVKIHQEGEKNSWQCGIIHLTGSCHAARGKHETKVLVLKKHHISAGASTMENRLNLTLKGRGGGRKGKRQRLPATLGHLKEALGQQDLFKGLQH